jgi:hypothetical protein
MIGKGVEDGLSTSYLTELFLVKGVTPTYEIRRYWHRKYLFAGEFHPGTHGGARNVKLGPELRRVLKYA